MSQSVQLVTVYGLTPMVTSGRGSPRAIARDCYYFPATISKALAEMGASGYLISRVEGRHRYYKLIPETWREILLVSPPSPWIVWARLFSAFDQIWQLMWSEAFEDKSPLAQASLLRRILRDSAGSQIDRAGLLVSFGDDAPYIGEALIPFFTDRMTAVLNELESK